MKENEAPVPLPEIKQRSDKTTSIITLVSDNGRLTVTTDFEPQLDPKNPTFDQAAAAIGLQAIAEFLRKISSDNNEKPQS